VVFCKLFWTDKHRRICSIFPTRSFWFYEWSRSNHYTSSIIPFVGLNSAKSTFAIWGFAPTFSEFNIHALALGVLTVLIYYLTPLLTKAIPSAAAWLLVLLRPFLGWDVPIIGEIPSGIPNLNPIQHYTTRSIHLNSSMPPCWPCWVVLTPYWLR
jgi:MFS superfamily sulfate permease-like transporter